MCVCVFNYMCVEGGLNIDMNEQYNKQSLILKINKTFLYRTKNIE